MSEPDVRFIDASEWIQLEWYNSGGTRAKRVLQSPDGKEWYFKCSEKKPAKNGKPEKYYRYEFWSEIIAFQLGKQLGLDMLRYDVAVHEGVIGCISPLMIDREKEQLVEVGRYMTSLNPAFLPEDNSTRNEYTFQLLEHTLNKFGLTDYWTFFFSTILFDAIIGNTDRHQENWAFKSKSTFITESIERIEQQIKLNGFKKMGWLIKKAFSKMFDKEKNELNNEGREFKLFYVNIIGTAPVYDSGSSLARELSDERVGLLLEDNEALEKYIANGSAELHWEKKKISHFQLVENLLNSSYIEEVKRAAEFINLWNDAVVAKIINTLDGDLPTDWHSYCIPDQRKALIIKLLTLRSQKLRGLINGRI